MRILVVEDDRAIAQTLELLLSQWNDAVDIAADGKVGLQMVEAHEYDLIVLDALLPKLDGSGMGQRIREKRPQMPILLFDRQGKTDAEAGHDPLKSLNADELLARVQAFKLGTATLPKDSIPTQHPTRDPLHPLYPALNLPMTDPLTAPPSPELNLISEKLQTALKQLRLTQAELQQRTQDLETVHQTLHQERQQWQALHDHFEQRLIERTQAALSESAARQSFLVRFGDALRSLTDLAAIEATVTRLLAQHLGAAGAHYCTVTAAGVVVERDYATVGVHSLAGRHRLEDCGVIRDRSAFVTVDVAHDDRVLRSRENLRARGIGAFVTAPLVKNDRLVACFCVSHNAPRAWTPTEVALIEEVAERSWDAIERARTEAALLASEEKYRTLFSSIDEGVVLLEAIFDADERLIDLCYLEANAAAERMTGQELKGRWASQVLPDLEPAWFEILDRVVRTGEAIRWDLPIAPLNAWYDFYCFCPNPANPRRLAVIYKDIRDRKQAELALQESEERFRVLSEISPVGIFRNDLQGRCTYANAKTLEITGLSLEQNLGDGWGQNLHPEDRSWMYAAWSEFVEQTRLGHPVTYRVEPRYLYPDGSLKWIFAQAVPEYNAKREVVGYIGSVIDVTERKQAEQALQDSEQRLQAILDHAPAVIYLLDPQDRFLLVNRSYADLLSTTPDQIVGQHLEDIWPAEIAESFAVSNRTVLETSQLLQVEQVVAHPSGQLHTYITVKFPLCDATGTPYAVCGISTDITDKKQLEAQFYRAQRLESLGTLASGIAHDLNNVLTPILATAQFLQVQPLHLDARSQEMLKCLEASAKRGADLVQQILTFTRGTEGKRILVQVTDVLQEVIAVAQQTFPKSISIRQEIPTCKIRLISADPTQLHQVLMNLCVNARDAMPEGGLLTLSVQNFFVDERFAQMNLEAQVGNYVVIAISDTGTGISPALRDRIFDPFFTTKPVGQGTGLGLAIALGIVRSHGGFLHVLSEAGQGTEFRVYLPTTNAFPPEHQSAAEPPQGNGALVLMVEDDRVVQCTARLLLEGSHYQILTANDGIEAISLYTQHQPEIQVVLMDVMMPNMDGISTIRKLHNINPDVKIIALSGLSTHREAALSAGASVFLSKPYALKDLLTTVSDLMHGELKNGD